MKAIIDGFNAPLTAGAFIDLSSRNFYSNLPINRAEEFFVLLHIKRRKIEMIHH